MEQNIKPLKCEQQSWSMTQLLGAICQPVSVQVRRLFGMGLGPLKGVGKCSILVDALWCNLEPILRGHLIKCPPPLKKLFQLLPQDYMPMEGHRVWSYTQCKTWVSWWRWPKTRGIFDIVSPTLWKWSGVGWGTRPFHSFKGEVQICQRWSRRVRKLIYVVVRPLLHFRCSGMQSTILRGTFGIVSPTLQKVVSSFAPVINARGWKQGLV